MRKLIALLTGLALAAVVYLAGATTIAGASPEARAARLQSFASCDALLRYAKRHGSRIVGPWGLGSLTALPVRAAGPEEAAPSGAQGAVPGVDYSTTNVQEEGVDEPDIVKSDGSHIFVIAQGKLQAVDVRGPKPRLVGSLQLEQGWNHQLFLHGNRVLVLSSGGFEIQPLPAVAESSSSILPVQTGTVLTEVDVSDPAVMRVVRTLKVDGSYLNARLTGSIARVVITSTPIGLEFAAPSGSDSQATAEATARNRAVIARSRLRNWVPSYVLANERTGRKTKRVLAGCRQIKRPPEFSGLGMITVLTIDIAKGLEPVDSDAVMTDGQTVYASPESLYVATQRWIDPIVYSESDVVPPSMTTAVHKFDISDPAKTEYRGSGEVAGFLLNQWSLSEHKGFLRVATTEQPVWWQGSPVRESESFVTVLEDAGGKLVQVGRVGELGRGERIYAVRFIGDVGYVVTFRQVDPLYTIDLSNPAHPAVMGELKILGYSAYLHPLGGDLLLGVGQDATVEGRVLGTQLSVFDISNLRSPVRLHQRTIGPGSSEAEWDHHAFLYWPAKRLTVLPIQTAFLDPQTGLQNGFVGAIGFRVGREIGIAKVGTVSHVVLPPDPQPEPVYPWAVPIRRSLVVGDTLYTVSEQGLKASSLDTLSDRAWIAFA